LNIAREKGQPQKKPQGGAGNKRLPGKIVVNSNMGEIERINVKMKTLSNFLATNE
jgi:hypothetical protein